MSIRTLWPNGSSSSLSVHVPALRVFPIRALVQEVWVTEKLYRDTSEPAEPQNQPRQETE